MNFWSKIAFTLVVAAGLSAAQTPSNDQPSQPAPGAGAGAAASAPSPAAAPAKPAAGSASYNNPYSPSAQLPPTPVAPRPAAPPPLGNVTPASAAGGKPVAANVDTSKYILGPNDVIAVSVFDEQHVPGTYVIGPDGEINMPLIGNFQAIGITIPVFQHLIAEKLSAFIIDPVVNVQLLRSNSKWYTVMGGVNRSGPYPLVRQITILDAMAACGGFHEFAETKKIYLLRGSKRFPFNYKDVIAGKHTDQNIPIEDGDLIVVPE